jgi:hypothetical protein
MVATIRAQLVDSWTKEDSPIILKRLNHIMAQSAASGDWNEFLPFVLSTSMKMNTTNIVAALDIIEILAEYSPDLIFANISILGSFLGGFIASADSKVSTACARATSACIVSLDDEIARNSFKPALPPIITVVGNCLSLGQEGEAASIMERLVTIAQVQPLFFRTSLDLLVGAMLTVTNSTSLEFSTRTIALELLVSLAETAPAMARRCAPLMEGLVPAAMQIMLEVEADDTEWLQSKYAEDSLDENYVVGEEAIERITAGMGGKSIIPLVLPLAQSFAASPHWYSRRAAVAAITRLAEGAEKMFEVQLPICCDFLFASLHDSSVRVQYEAEQAVGQLALLFPNAVDDLIKRFLPRLIALLGEPHTCVRVRGHAAAAMINLCSPENIEAEVLQPFLESILTALVACLQGAPLDVQAPCLVLLGCVAKVSDKAFAPYYGSLMPGIKSILANSSADSLIKGKAMECAGLLVEAVGSSIASVDALQILNFLIRVVVSGAHLLAVNCMSYYLYQGNHVCTYE